MQTVDQETVEVEKDSASKKEKEKLFLTQGK